MSTFIFYRIIREGNIFLGGLGNSIHKCSINWTSFFLFHLPEDRRLRGYNKVQFSSVTQSCPTICDPIAASQASLSITNSQSLLKLMPIESLMPSSHLILCRPLLLLPPIPPSIRVFSSESTLRMRLILEPKKIKSNMDIYFL